MFPRWTSHAYHGLVDLRLFSTSTRDESDNKITEAQLVRILEVSPRLRILHFELKITHRPETRTAASRVRLADLEVVRVGSAYDDFTRIEHLLRLLEPGPKPLHLSIQCDAPETDTEFSTLETKAFFTRSKGLDHVNANAFTTTTTKSPDTFKFTHISTVGYVLCPELLIAVGRVPSSHSSLPA
ncbi:hypothetical protein ACGC1H_000289 [Rhizoctonia solani]